MLKRPTKTPSVRRRERGLQLVETAIVMPVLIMMLGGIAEFGRYFHMRSTMLRATMAGAIYMSDKQNTASEQLAASRMAACGQPTACTAAQLLYPGVGELNMTVAITGNVITGQTVTVATANVIYQPVFYIIRPTYTTNARGQLVYANLSGRSWLSRPINVNTAMRFAGS